MLLKNGDNGLDRVRISKLLCKWVFGKCFASYFCTEAVNKQNNV